MTDHEPNAAPSSPNLLLWPGVALLLAQWLLRFGLPLAIPDSMILSVLGALLAGVAIVIWWVFVSRASRLERWGGLAVVMLAIAGARPLLHESVRTGGMGFVYFLYVVPAVCAALVGAAVVVGRLRPPLRLGLLSAAIIGTCAAWTLVRTEGTTGSGDWDFSWRWSPTAEERLLAAADEVPSRRQATVLSEADWPGFRGPQRNGVVNGVRVATDWALTPPVELWRREVGPGWSSFAIGGGLVFTQEQRGADEVVSAYDAATGEPVWFHRDPARFWEAQAGAGPRATPTLADGRLYSLGATGIVNALDAASGALLWQRDVSADSGRPIPGWGFAASPLVLGDQVLVAAAGQLVAYDRETGERLWTGPPGSGYSSPHVLSLDGVLQVLMLSGSGARSFDPAGGALLWEYASAGGDPIVQPARTEDGDLLLAGTGVSGGLGITRIAVTRDAGEWTVSERWRSNRLKPNYNDFVVHEGYAYGFDGSILACIDLEDGSRAWKGGRYGNGQLVLLRDQDVLLVLSERGELALVTATPERFQELARVPAIAGKTWNHPAVVGDLLLVRNGREMAAFHLPLEGPSPTTEGPATSGSG